LSLQFFSRLAHLTNDRKKHRPSFRHVFYRVSSALRLVEGNGRRRNASGILICTLCTLISIVGFSLVSQRSSNERTEIPDYFLHQVASGCLPSSVFHRSVEFPKKKRFNRTMFSKIYIVMYYIKYIWNNYLSFIPLILCKCRWNSSRLNYLLRSSRCRMNFKINDIIFIILLIVGNLSYTVVGYFFKHKIYASRSRFQFY